MKKLEDIIRPGVFHIVVLLGLVHLASAQALPPPAPQSFAYVLQADAFAKTKASGIQRLAASDRDWIVLDANFSGDSPWTRADLKAIRSARPGRKILCYLSIGEAEDYRAYWKDSWLKNGELTSAAPAWLIAENPDWAGNYRIKYWAKGWQQIMLPVVDSAMAAGFDGVYLDIVDGFEFFEQDGNQFIDNRINPQTGKTYRRDMVDWVKTIAAHVRTDHPSALVIPQNGSQLLAQPDFLVTVSGIGIEDLLTNGNQLQPKADTNYVLGFLKKITAARKPVLLIEYATTAARKSLVKSQARKLGFTWLLTDRNLKTIGVSAP